MDKFYDFCCSIIQLLIDQDRLSFCFLIIIIYLLFDRLNTRMYMEDLEKKYKRLEHKHNELQLLFNDQLSPFALGCMASFTLGLGLMSLSTFCFLLFSFLSQPANIEEMVIVYKGLAFPENKHFLLEFVDGKWRENR